jgi:glycine cleavage system H lipoate-binding protein
MVVLFVVLTIILFISIDYVIQRRKKVGLASQPIPGTVSLSKLLSLVPNGVFVQPSFTWSKMLDSGNLLLGIHPILMGLVGDPDEIELLHQGEDVKKGQPILRIHKNNKELAVASPVEGTVTGLNSQIVEDATMENLSQNWIYSLRPVNVSSEVPKWFVAEKAKSWINERYNQIGKFFRDALPTSDLGITMADGGDLPFGILSQFDESTWEKFEKQFIKMK